MQAIIVPTWTFLKTGLTSLSNSEVATLMNRICQLHERDGKEDHHHAAVSVTHIGGQSESPKEIGHAGSEDRSRRLLQRCGVLPDRN